jgi:hypothetical protein
MTDELEPNRTDPAADADATTHVPAPPPNMPPPVVPSPPTAPLTPASRASTTPQPYEHEVAWSSVAPATPVVAAAAAPRRRGRLRWAISLAIIALVIATSAAVAAIITGRSSNAVVLGYVPEGTIVYGEARLDLPGDQRRAVGEFLAKFPGFHDQAALDSKLDQVLDDLVKDASKGDQTYTADIAPWFGGELGFSVGPLPPASSLSGGDHSAALGSFRALALVSVKDAAGAQAWFDKAIAKTGATTTTESYNGATMTVFAKADGPKAALALIDGKVAAAGDIASVKAAVDTKGASGFASEPGPKAALESATGDYVGFAYVALRPLLDWSNGLSKAIPQSDGTPVAPLGAAIAKAIPDWSAYWLRFENDAVVMQAAAPSPATAIGPTENRTSAVVEHIPATAILASTSNDFGKTLKQALDLARSDANAKPVFDKVDQALGLIGGEDAALGWAGDTAFVVNVSDGTPEGGLIVAPTDKVAAGHLFTALRTFIALGGSQQGISVRDEPYNGATITVVDLGDIGDRAGMAGGMVSGALKLPSGHIEIAYAVTDDVVVIGSSPSFVKHVLDTTKATSLGSNARYTNLVDRAGASTGTTFVDITAIRGLIEKAAGSADPAELAKYEKDIKPFLVPFDAMVASSSVSGDLHRSVIYVTVK